MRAYSKGAEAKRKAAVWQRGWRERSPEKQAAHSAVGQAIKTGKLVRPSVCEGCGEDAFCEAHHSDYSRKLDVEWLCKTCHVLEDGGRIA